MCSASRCCSSYCAQVLAMFSSSRTRTARAAESGVCFICTPPFCARGQRQILATSFQRRAMRFPPLTAPLTTPLTPPLTAPLTTPLTPPLTAPLTTPLSNMLTTPLTAPLTTPLTAPLTTPLTPPLTAPLTTPLPPRLPHSPHPTPTAPPACPRPFSLL